MTDSAFHTHFEAVKMCVMVLVHCLAVSLIYGNKRVSTLTRVFSDARTKQERLLLTGLVHSLFCLTTDP